jgi:hypothetical protein
MANLIEVLELFKDKDDSIKVIEDNDWIAESKYQYREIIVEHESRFYSIGERK